MHETATAIEATVKAAGQARQKEDHHKEQAAEFDRRAKALGEEIDRGAKFLQLADAMEKVKGKLAAYPADLADQVTQAEADEKAADEGKQTGGRAIWPPPRLCCNRPGTTRPVCRCQGRGDLFPMRPTGG